jgi:hypothetical protein
MSLDRAVDTPASTRPSSQRRTHHLHCRSPDCLVLEYGAGACSTRSTSGYLQESSLSGSGSQAAPWTGHGRPPPFSRNWLSASTGTTNQGTGTSGPGQWLAAVSPPACTHRRIRPGPRSGQEGVKPGAPGRIRTRDPLLRRHQGMVAACRLISLIRSLNWSNRRS